MTEKARRETKHGVKLAAGDTETIWGWGGPAGSKRAERRAELIIEGAGMHEGSKVLEIGCGTGLFTEKFAATGASILAVDISPELLRKAARRGLDPARVAFVERRFEECALEGPFDAVIGSSVLHHLDLEDGLQKIHQLLKPGKGMLCFAEPNYLNPIVCIERVGARLPGVRRLFWKVSPDETAFVRGILKRTLARHGYRDILITPFDWLHPATPPWAIPFVTSLGKTLERLPLVREFAGSLWIRARRP